jgi:molecular chaperone GrpE (heat shock protein)
VVIDILKIISKYETAGGVIECKSELIMLIDNIIDLLVSRYGLEVIDGPAADVDPAIHQVVEVINSDKENSGIVRLARGYRMGKKIIMPMKVRVIKNE